MKGICMCFSLVFQFKLIDVPFWKIVLLKKAVGAQVLYPSG